MLVNGTADPLFPYTGAMGMANGRAGEPMLGAEATAAFFTATTAPRAGGHRSR